MNITGGGNTFPISMGLPEDFGEFDGESSFFLLKTATDTPAYNSSGGYHLWWSPVGLQVSGGWMMFGEELQGIDSLEVSVDLQMAYCFQIFRASHHPSFAERF